MKRIETVAKLIETSTYYFTIVNVEIKENTAAIILKSFFFHFRKSWIYAFNGLVYRPLKLTRQVSLLFA